MGLGKIGCAGYIVLWLRARRRFAKRFFPERRINPAARRTSPSLQLTASSIHVQSLLHLTTHQFQPQLCNLNHDHSTYSDTIQHHPTLTRYSLIRRSKHTTFWSPVWPGLEVIISCCGLACNATSSNDLHFTSE